RGVRDAGARGVADAQRVDARAGEGEVGGDVARGAFENERVPRDVPDVDAVQQGAGRGEGPHAHDAARGVDPGEARARGGLNDDAVLRVARRVEARGREVGRGVDVDAAAVPREAGRRYRGVGARREAQTVDARARGDEVLHGEVRAEARLDAVGGGALARDVKNAEPVGVVGQEAGGAARQAKPL